jgi:predicted TIM-barrel fold metal-dependent hydrolase
MRNHEPSFADRLSTADKAKRQLVEKARRSAPANDPNFAERQAAAEANRIAAEAAAEANRIAAAAAAQAQREADAAAQAERELQLETERKAARDARYAARKARQRG